MNAYANSSKWVFPSVTALLPIVMGCAAAYAENTSVSVAVTGHITPACSIVNTSPVVGVGEIKARGAASASFFLSCNSNFGIALSSQNGGLLQTDGYRATAPFLAFVPYEVSLKLAGGDLIASCKSDLMKAASPACSGIGRAELVASGQNVAMRISWDLHGLIPVSGAYQDVLTVTVTPRL